MIICLSGAHRTGKTTLAAALAKAIELEYFDTDISGAQKRLGFDSSKQDYTFEERIAIQEGLYDYFSDLLNASAKVAAEHKCTIIMDRSPLDLIGYTLSLAQASTLTEAQSDWLNGYIERCQNLTSHFVDVVVGIQPGIPLDPSKLSSAPSNVGYIEHINHILMGAIATHRGNTSCYVMPRNITDPTARLDYMKYVGADYYQRIGRYK